MTCIFTQQAPRFPVLVLICSIDKNIFPFPSLKNVKKDFLCKTHSGFLGSVYFCAQETHTCSDPQAPLSSVRPQCCLPRSGPHCSPCSEVLWAQHCPQVSLDGALPQTPVPGRQLGDQCSGAYPPAGIKFLGSQPQLLAPGFGTLAWNPLPHLAPVWDLGRDPPARTRARLGLCLEGGSCILS